MNLPKVLTLYFLLTSVSCFANVWNQKANFGGTARHRASGFVIGEKGYIGMGHTNSGAHVIYDDIWEYDPSTNSWTQKASFGGGKRYQCAAFSLGGKAYLGLGRNPQNTYENDFWSFDPLSNLWTPIADFPGEERRGASAFNIGNRGYVGLGQATSGYASDFYKYNPNSNTWTQVADFIGAPRTSAVSFVHQGKAYVGTGHTYSAALKDFYEFNPTSDYWTQKQDIGDSLRQDATGFTLLGNGYLGTGNNVDGSINYKDFWKYDFDLDSWTQIEDFEGASRRYMVSFVIGETAFAGGGTNGTNLKDFWSYNPQLALGIADEVATSFVIANPVQETIFVDVSGEANSSEMLLYDLSGKLILRYRLFEGRNETVRDAIKNGIYLYRIIKNEALLESGKLLFL